MSMECYEDMALHCAELLAQANTVDAEENREAVRIASERLRFEGLEMKKGK